MPKDISSAARQQDAGNILFQYREQAWDGIRQSLGLDADALDAFRSERSRDTMRFSGTVRFSDTPLDTKDLQISEVVVLNLRTLLQDAASNYRLGRIQRSRMTAKKIREALVAERKRITAAHAGCEAVMRKGLLWKFELEGVACGAPLQLKLEELVPVLSAIEAHFTAQLGALKPSEYRPEKNQNARKPNQDAYYAELLRIWNELVKRIPELKPERRLDFFLAAAVPVMGANVATRAAIRTWLLRHG